MTSELVTTANVKSDPDIRLRLREELKRNGLTVEEVAESSGIAKGTLDNIMTGRTESMKDVHIQAIWRSYPDLRFRYVLTGQQETTPSVIVSLKKSGDVIVKVEE